MPLTGAQQTTLGQPVELPLDGWLYGYTVSPECGVCKALDRQFAEAEKHKDHRAMYQAAAEIRNHPHDGKQK